MSAPRRTSNTPSTGVGRKSSCLTPGMLTPAAARFEATDGFGAGRLGLLPGLLATSPAQAPFTARLDVASAVSQAVGTVWRRGLMGSNLTTGVGLRPSRVVRTGLDRPFGSAARMMARVQFLQALAGHVRIDLRGRQVAVPEQHLHHPQIRPVVEQMGCERVSERVRGEIAINARLAGITFDDVPERLARHAI